MLADAIEECVQEQDIQLGEAMTIEVIKFIHSFMCKAGTILSEEQYVLLCETLDKGLKGFEATSPDPLQQYKNLHPKKE